MPWPLVKLVPKKTHFRFVQFATIAAVASILAIVGTFASIFSGGFQENPIAVYQAAKGGPGDKLGAIVAHGFNLGIDFKGGTLLELTAPAPVDIGRVRAGLAAMGLGDIQVQSFGDPRHALIRFQPETNNPGAEVEVVKQHIQTIIPGVTFSRTEVVGPKVSGELFTSGLLALGLAILLMLFYIWFRFEWQFGLGAVMALFHDTVLTLGIFSVFRLDFTLTVIAALLTIIGYSMNDTVVVFDRMRENFRKFKLMKSGDIIDLSINETLSRTMMTVATALLASIALYLYGGPTLNPFAICMIFGIVVATYSSIYIAAPALPLVGERPGAPGAKLEPKPRPEDARG